MKLFFGRVSGSPCSYDGTPWKDAKKGRHIVSQQPPTAF